MKLHPLIPFILFWVNLAFPQDSFTPPPGVPVPEGIRKALIEEVGQLKQSIDDLRQQYRDDAGRLDLINDVVIYYNAVHYALIHVQFYPDKKQADFEIAFQQLAKGRERADALRKGQAPWKYQTGLVVRGYLSDIDGSVQPYGLVIPESYDPNTTKKQRLDIWYHGRGNTLSELKFIHQRETDAGKLQTDKAIVLHPYGRYCNANKFAGEVDTFEAIEHVKRHYPIDADRMTVRGFSMGGAATWHMATHHAGLWSAAAPGAGFAESAIYAKVMEKEPQPSWYELKLHNLYDATKYTANLAQCPTVAYSGSGDKQKQAADIMAGYMAAEGMELMHVIGEGMGHKYDDISLETINSTIDEWAGKPKHKYPDTIQFVTHTLRYNSMYWLTVDALETHWEEARVNAGISTPSSINLTTANVAALTLEFPAGKAPAFETTSVNLSIDGIGIQIPRPPEDQPWKISLHKQDLKWKLSSNEQPSGLKKMHGLQGPVDDAFMDSFLFVIPSENEFSSPLSHWIEDEVEDARQQWWRQFRGEPRVKRDVDVTLDDIRNHHLILWGDPSSNGILKRIQHSLPITWSKNTFTVHNFHYDVRGFVPVLVYPNPLNPDRYVVLNSGFTFSEFSGGTNALQIPKLPDWAVLDMSVSRGQRHPSGVVDAGFFDERWQYKSH